MAEVVSNSGPATETDISGSDPANQSTEYDDVSGLDDVDSPVSPEGSLPGKPRQDGAINWLGSSYSGADIKVVAHLYSPLETDKEIDRLRKQAALYRQIADAASTLSTSLPPAQQLQSTFAEEFILRASGIGEVTEENQAAASEIISVFDGTPFPGSVTIWTSMLQNNYRQLGEIDNGLAKQLDDQIKNRENIRKNSLQTVTLATLQTLSIQTHREKIGVRALGTSYVKGYTRGPRTIAGSMIFTLFNENALAQLIRSMSGKGLLYGEMDTEVSTLIADQLPPLDLTIVFANEYGSLSQMGIYGVEFQNDGMTMSIEDLLTEQVLNFVARDCDVMTSKGNIPLSRLQRAMHYNEEGKDTSGTSLLFSGRAAYNEYLDKLRVRRRLLNR